MTKSLNDQLEEIDAAISALEDRRTCIIHRMDTTSRKEEHMNLKRTRYQQGSLRLEKRKTGHDVWAYRWREIGSNGQTIRHKKVVGTKLEYPSKAAAMRAVNGLRLDINIEATSSSSGQLTVDELIEHYKLTELNSSNSKTARTKEVYLHQLKSMISPKWGKSRLQDVEPIPVEKWLGGLPGAPGTKTKTKGVMSIIFQHAMRYGWATSNPIRLVRQSGLPVKEEIVLRPLRSGTYAKAVTADKRSAQEAIAALFVRPEPK
jgi:hypothetical protein